MHADVELRRAVAQFDTERDGLEARNREASHAVRTHVEHRLEHRGARRVSGKVESFDDRVERDVTVLERVEDGGLHMSQQLGRRHVGPWVETDRKRVDEEPGDRFEVEGVPFGAGDADDHVGLACVPMQQRGIPRHQGHEERCSLATPQGCQRLDRAGAHRHANDLRVPRCTGRAEPV